MKFDFKIRILTWSKRDGEGALGALFERRAILPEAEAVAHKIVQDVRLRGDAAVVEYVRQHDGASLTPARLRVTEGEINAARESVDVGFSRSAQSAYKRIQTFAQAGLRKDWNIQAPRGGLLGEQYVPLERVGVYIPGGTAPLASTALMTITLARTAGVQEIVACTPANARGKLNPQLLYCIHLAGATEVFKVGGAQAIAAMACGTKAIRKVQKIVGPGGPYVTAAKRLVYGDVDLDMVAGPSEIAILADDTAQPEYVAADLLSQAEHGTGHEKTLLVTSSKRLAVAVQERVVRQAATLPRGDAIHQVLTRGSLIVVVPNLDEGMELCNRFAPEHLEIMVREPRTWLRKVKTAGAVFLGPWTPEAAGDFAAGPSHVLPTGGTAAFFSGLTAESFRRRISILSLTHADLQDMLPVVEEFGRVEGLDAHARSARIRFTSFDDYE